MKDEKWIRIGSRLVWMKILPVEDVKKARQRNKSYRDKHYYLHYQELKNVLDAYGVTEIGRQDNLFSTSPILTVASTTNRR